MLNKLARIVLDILLVGDKSIVTAKIESVSQLQTTAYRIRKYSLEQEKVKTIPFSGRFGASIHLLGAIQYYQVYLSIECQRANHAYFSQEENSFFSSFDRFLGPSRCKDYFLKTEVLCKYKLGSEKSQSSDCCGFTNLLHKSLKCHEAYFFERIKHLAEEAIGNIQGKI